MNFKLKKNLNKITVSIAAWIVFLLISYVLITILIHYGINDNTNFFTLFDLDKEKNIPTATNSILLFTTGLFSVYLFIKIQILLIRIIWLLTGLLFIYLAIDEFFIIHEQFGAPLRQMLDINNGNPLYHAWVIPVGLSIPLVSAIFWILLRHNKNLKVFSGLYIKLLLLTTGVVSLEILGTQVYGHNMIYQLVMVPLEEVFELSMGLVLLRYVIQKVIYYSKK